MSYACIYIGAPRPRPASLLSSARVRSAPAPPRRPSPPARRAARADDQGGVCSKSYSHQDAARKHSKKHHALWLGMRDARRLPICCEAQMLPPIRALAALQYGPHAEMLGAALQQVRAPSVARAAARAGARGLTHPYAPPQEGGEGPPEERLAGQQPGAARELDRAELRLQLAAIRSAEGLDARGKALAALRVYAGLDPARAGDWERLLLEETTNVPKSRFFPSVSAEHDEVVSQGDVALAILDGVCEHVEALVALPPCSEYAEYAE